MTDPLRSDGGKNLGHWRLLTLRTGCSQPLICGHGLMPKHERIAGPGDTARRWGRIINIGKMKRLSKPEKKRWNTSKGKCDERRCRSTPHHTYRDIRLSRKAGPQELIGPAVKLPPLPQPRTSSLLPSDSALESRLLLVERLGELDVNPVLCF